MMIAGEASGDMLAAELVRALRRELAVSKFVPTTDFQPLDSSLEPRFFGAGGPRMAAAGVELAFDMTAHSIIGLSDAIKHYVKFRRLFGQLLVMARERQPDVIICVDFSGFNRRFAHAIKTYLRPRSGWFHDWRPKIVQYVSPQVWASREDRVFQIAQDYDLLLSIFPFEEEWYARRVPSLPVEFVGHPIVDRYPRSPSPAPPSSPADPAAAQGGHLPFSLAHALPPPNILLLPGSRPGELRRHIPSLIAAAKHIMAVTQARFKMVLPDVTLAEHARQLGVHEPQVQIQIGKISEALEEADLAITKSGTITLECAWFGVPAVVFYKTSLATYMAGRHYVKVKYLAMPNLLADEELFPEFIQNQATPENLARAALNLLQNEKLRQSVKIKLAEISASLGTPGASGRAARAILRLLSVHSEPAGLAQSTPSTQARV
jgi:lipid-A-disaccharide synthase